MKVEQINLDEKDKIEAIAEIPDKTGKLIDSIKPHKGHILFEINVITGKCEEAIFESIDISYVQAANGNAALRKKVISKPGCVYVSALNKKNALIKFFKSVQKQSGVK